VAALFQPRPDVLVSTSPQFFCAVAGWIVARVRRLPWVFELRDLWPASIVAVGAMQAGIAVRLLERLELKMYHGASLIVSVTHAFQADLVGRGVDARKVHVVLNGVDLARYSPRPKDEALIKTLGLEGCFVVGYLGTIGMAHALDKVLDAAVLLRARKDIVLVIAGSGARRSELEARVASEGLDNVRFLPAQEKQLMPALWSIHDVALIPLQRHDLFRTVIPSKMFEAMGMGVPILMSLPEGEATDLLKQTGAGICVPPEDPQSLAEAIVGLVGDPARMQELKVAALKAAPKFSRQANARSMLSLFREAAQPDPEQVYSSPAPRLNRDGM
jgi:colanic acid biosynthesis glycosyl transferase WcaI